MASMTRGTLTARNLARNEALEKVEVFNILIGKYKNCFLTVLSKPYMIDSTVLSTARNNIRNDYTSVPVIVGLAVLY
jgi:hypothetical protein